jgi:hypothetical protein
MMMINDSTEHCLNNVFCFRRGENGDGIYGGWEKKGNNWVFLVRSGNTVIII